MEKKILNELKEKLEKQHTEIKEQLNRFAKKDENLKHDWDTTFPQMDEGAAGSQQLEEGADEVQEYGNMLPVEHNMELRLRDIESALEKIKNGKYGNCEKCGKKIDEERLMVYPEGRLCQECQWKKA